MLDKNTSLEELNSRSKGNMSETLGIRFTAIGDNYLEATMPVDHRTVQPAGLLHGGASAALAETVGSMAGYQSIDREKYYCVGVEIKCNHLKSKTEGIVTARATPLHTGRKIHVWEIRISDEENRLICFSTLTLAVIPANSKKMPGRTKNL
jgi:1,4-dihydroxy-2-naphthoyl-CoA hydrolase